MSPDDEFRQINCMIQYHFKIDPDNLSDDEWCKRWGELEWIITQENKRNQM